MMVLNFTKYNLSVLNLKEISKKNKKNVNVWINLRNSFEKIFGINSIKNKSDLKLQEYLFLLKRYLDYWLD